MRECLLPVSRPWKPLDVRSVSLRARALDTKVATSPFAAVAGLVGASGDDLAQVAFTSGSPCTSDVESAELGSLVPILVERPALHLEIRGRADPVADTRGLRREKIEPAVRPDAYERVSSRARDLVPAESLPPLGEERDRVVAEAALGALAAEIELAESDWRRLARARAAAIQGSVLASAEISTDRLYLTEVEIGPAADGESVAALLELTTN